MLTNDRELRYRIALSRLRGLTADHVRQLLAVSGSAEALFESGAPLWQPSESSGRRLFTSEKRTDSLAWADREIPFVRQKAIAPLFCTDPDYPRRLAECPDAPVLLYYKGDADLNARQVVTVVGTRRATAYGRAFCDDFVRELARLLPSVLVVSGLAYGIDVAAHRAAYAAGVKTVGVLAHGLHTIYPKPHRSLAAGMIGRGGLLTEYGSQDLLHQGCFVARNRIVAGLSDVTVVVESPQKGGGLITAGIAVSYGRDVFALPGRIGDLASEGCNRLIAENRAGLLESAAGLIRHMLWDPAAGSSSGAAGSPEPALTAEEARLLAAFGSESERHIDGLAAESGFSTAQTGALLLGLEFKNCIRPCPGSRYRKL